MRPGTEPFDSHAFRSALGTFPTGITAVCARLADGAVTGLAANSFTSVSLDPPLVSVCIATDSSTWGQMQHASGFAVSILSGDHGDVCRRLASTDPDRLGEVAWEPAPSGAPVIQGALAWFDCSIWSRQAAGDHEIVVGRVDALAEADPEASPLLFFRSTILDRLPATTP